MRNLLRGTMLPIALICAGCAPDAPPPPSLYFAGVPVSGNLDVKRRERFDTCFNDTARSLSCRRHGIMLFGQGPYEATIDLRGGTGQSGFSYITLWHNDDQRAVFNVLPELVQRGWHYCYTGNERAGDQAIFTRTGEPVYISVDISYYGNRRIRIFPNTFVQRINGKCISDKSLGRFGIMVEKNMMRAW
jgi:hypothetical protein